MIARWREGAVLVGVLFVHDVPEVRLAPVEDHFYQADEIIEGRYRFTSGWHGRHVEIWSQVLAPLRGQPDLGYLEVGVFEGRSLLWMLDNVLTHASARATAVDVFGSSYEATFDANLEISGSAAKVTKLVGPSGHVLRGLGGATFDVIYIDGSHTADDVLLDATLCWDLLKPGGLMIFDDYAWPGRRGAEPLPEELRPQLAIDAFITANRYAIEIVHRDYQVIVRKHDNPCTPKDYCSPVGQYNYFWRARELWTRGGAPVELDEEEIAMIEALARARSYGEVEIAVPSELRSSEAFARLSSRLELDL